ncbi:Noc1p protein [Histoplasma capsulatum]|uniref:Noc1p protein n=2 Tax=Histoplasma TaxID=5036 RepID=A0A8A1MM64_AJECA|nr:Noc1p protein [Histoplasma capsulatum]
MAPLDDIQVGDLVNVPGGMYGTVKFLGPVAGKPGRFAGVELAPEHAGRGKNNGDVEGRSYFTTSLPGSGIFVPMNNNKYVSKRTASMGSTPPTPSKPPFSKSVGPGAGPGPLSVNRPKFRRPSLPRPESPRASPPKLNLTALRTPSAFSKSIPANGGVPRTPLRATRPPSRPSSRISIESGMNTPGSIKRHDTRTPALNDGESTDRIKHLEKQLRDRDKQLEDQASTLAEFQKSITELEGLDALQVRAQLREKNEKIAALTAEFDSHRADFRSTLDTLEVAAAETERVYERRLEELMQANRELQDRGEDVETVARQLKQLEELVSELEDGLEDARRGEAEARGEVEFLRGEVERTRLELKQEREKSNSVYKGAGGDGHASSKDLDQKDDEIRGLKAIIHSLSRGEPTGLTHINVGTANNGDHQDADRIARLEHRIEELESLADHKSYRIEELERELENAQNQNRPGRNRSGTITSSPLKQRHNSAGTGTGAGGANHTHTLSDRTIVPNDWHDTTSPPPRSSNGHNQYPHFSPPHQNEPIRHQQQLESMQESDSRSSSTEDSGALWCEICETSGHDILTCTNMFGSAAANTNAAGKSVANNSKSNNGYNSFNGNTHQRQQNNLGTSTTNGYNNNNKASGSPSSQRTGRDAVLEGLKGIGGLTANMSPVAGKASGVIDESKWCALCERDGHESIDCPFED